jgi:GT2 family glycosyltransferase
MGSQEIKIYVIIVTYNGLHWLDKCLGSLKKSMFPVQPLVIDNCSVDDTVSFIQSNYPEVIVFKNKENQGFGKANNTGIQYALEHQANYIYLLNQDAWIDPETIGGLVQLMEKNPQYAIISPMQYAGNEKDLDKNFQFLLSPNFCENILNDLIINNLRSDLYPAKFVMAAHWMIRTAALKDTGAFSPLFKHYGEDKDLINRMLFHGWKSAIAPCFKGYHDRENRKETVEGKMNILYAGYLAQAGNINKSIFYILPCFIQFSMTLFHLEKNIFKSGKYICKALISCIPVIRHRYYSKKTKNEHSWN